MEVTRKKIFSNVFWGFAERICAQLVSFIVSIIIARILEPEAYGTIALVIIFLDILQIFVDSGLGNALIQKKDADSLDFSTVFFTNVVICVILYIIMFFCAPLISKFYGNLQLIKIIRVISVSLIISGVKNVQFSYVSKNLIFKKFFFATIIGTICAAFVGILMAYKGFGVWALVAQSLTNTTIDTIILWLTVRWRPKFKFSVKRLRALYSYGWKILVTATINSFYNKIRELLIGKLYSPAELAYYNRGYSLSYLIVGNIDGAISNVILPSMANEQDDINKIKNLMIKMMTLTSFILLPCLLGVVAVADNLIEVLLTKKWMFTVPYLRIFCVTFIFYPIFTGNLTVYKAIGRSDLYLKIEIVKKSIGFILLCSSVKFGAMAIAYSFLVTAVIEIFIDTFPNYKILGLNVFSQFSYLLKTYLSGVLMGIIVYMIGKMNLNVYIELFIQILAGIIIYIFFSVILKNESFFYIFGIIKNKIKKDGK